MTNLTTADSPMINSSSSQEINVQRAMPVELVPDRGANRKREQRAKGEWATNRMASECGRPLENGKHEHFAHLVAKGETPAKAYVLCGYSEKGPRSNL